MAERPSLTQVSQLGVESTYGTSVVATKRLQTVMITAGAKVTTKQYRPSGYKFSTVSAMGKEYSEMKLSGVPSFGELPYLLDSFLAHTTPSAQGTGGAYKWVFSPNTTAADTHTSYTLESGDSNYAEKYPGMVIPTLGFKFSRDAIDLSGAAFAQRLVSPFTLTSLSGTSDVQTVTITGTPTGGSFTLTVAVPWAGAAQTTGPIAYNATAAAVTTALTALTNVGVGGVTVTGGPGPGTAWVVTFAGSLANQPMPVMTHTDTFTGGATPAAAVAHTTPGVAIVPEPYTIEPVLPTQCDLYIDGTAGAIGSTAYTRGFEVDWNVGDYLTQIWPLQSSLASFAAFVEKESKPEIKVKLQADTQGKSQIANLRSGATQFMRIQATGPSIDGTLTGLLQLDCAMKVKDISEFADSGGVYCVTYTAQIMHDPGYGKALSCTVQNALAAL